MDPQLRLLLEATYEAILDGGGSPCGCGPAVASLGLGAPSLRFPPLQKS